VAELVFGLMIDLSRGNQFIFFCFSFSAKNPQATMGRELKAARSA
jgi:hypothetical protein